MSPTTWVFIVGNCKEFAEDRETLGDEKLHQSFLEYLPPNAKSNVVWLKDDQCTKANCEEKFKKLLQQSACPEDTLIFYYGGHGVRTGFRTLKAKWKYSEVVRMVEKYFCGQKVWFLVDCCHSGAFCRFLPSSSNKTYLCLTSTTSDFRASEGWTITESFIYRMHGGIPKTGETLQDFIKWVASRRAKLEYDWMQTAFRYPGNTPAIDPQAPFPYVIPGRPEARASATSDESRRPIGLMGVAGLFVSSLIGGGSGVPPSSAAMTSPFVTLQDTDVLGRENRWKRLTTLQKNDYIYALWKGGHVTGFDGTKSRYMLPAYYRAKILSEVDNESLPYNLELDLDVEFQSDAVHWSDKISLKDSVLPSAHFDYILADYIRAHKVLAQNGRYIDASIPMGSKLWGLYEDDTVVYGAIVVQDEMQHITSRAMKRKVYRDCYGPFLFVEWEDNDWSAIPKHNCMLASESSERPTFGALRTHAATEKRKTNTIALTPTEALVLNMKSMGKELKTIDKSEEHDVSCFWNGEWRKALMSAKAPSLESLLHHLEFDNVSGVYCHVQWIDDSSFAVVPETLLRYE